MGNVNLIDFAQTIDFANTLIRLGLFPKPSDISDLEVQLEMIKYRSYEAINDTYGGKYEGSRQRKNELNRTK